MDNELHIYVRVSSHTQLSDGFGLETQRESGDKLSKQLGLKPILWDEGDASSSKDDLDNRPVIVELLDTIERGEVKHLYVFNTDRLSRNQQTWGFIRYKLSSNNVLLYTGNNPSPIDLSDMTQDLLLGILGEISSYDNKLRRKRLTLGKVKRVKEGGWQGGPPPYGYQITSGRLKVQPYEKKWVKVIFEEYASGKTPNEIKDILLKNGVRTRRGNAVWSLGSIRSLIQNTHYSGSYQYRDKDSGEVIVCYCDALVSQSLYKKVSKLFLERSYQQKGRIKESAQKYDYLVKEYLVCDHCGGAFGSRRNKIQYYDHYYCRTKEKNWEKGEELPCKDRVRSIRIPVTDDIVWNSLVEVISTSHLFKETIKSDVMNTHNTYHNSAEDIKKSKKRILKLKKELDEIMKVSATTEAMKLLKQKSEEEVQQILSVLDEARIEKQSTIEDLQNQINDVGDSSKWVDWVKMFGDKIDELKSSTFSFEDKRILVDQLIDKIVVSSEDKINHKLKVYFKFPYVKDGFKWKFKKDKKGKSIKDGYELINGKKLYTTTFISNSKKKKR